MRRIVGLLVCAWVACGCSGVSTTIRADSARYPISFSRTVPTSSGRILYEGEGLRRVGELSESYWRFSVPYDAIEGEIDLSEDLNAAVQEAGGEAVVNLQVTSDECFLDWFIILNWLPIWPNCAVVSVEGDIVTREGNGAAGPPRGAAQ